MDRQGRSQDFLEGGAIPEATWGAKRRNFIPEATPLNNDVTINVSS